ncbi:putative nucleotidase [Sphingobium sp. SYK-6]|uniref:bifunctional metallophosphatase/5'-nucleotidase n=1 Tax=Sphingobium sp. (strain NBRC 103272 / SYK-6) TaxID=627192 RepID=UPI0002276BDF|nr:bifunctional metallophosphatase/5'-nucleotidase [Sphingobium sp. SYK-6]BAK65503.1 putative nucleotidase [Sphingobium sp. SYK-6]
MIGRLGAPLALLLLAACAQVDSGDLGRPGARPADVTTLQVIAFNDFHGHIGPDDQSVVPPDGAVDAPRVKAGGAVYFAEAVARLRAENANSAVVSAGDLISASPLISGHFLDEPTIRVMNDITIDFNALGNHEFDRGQDEIRRMQSGGCERYTVLEPCRVMPDFPGARFGFLAANTHQTDGTTLFPPYGIKRFDIGGKTVRIAFVGMTLKGTPEIVSPRSVAGLRFADEAETANALIPRLRAEGADILAILVHEGGVMAPEGDRSDCNGLTGALKPILQRLDPAFDLVISGHTHQAYVCSYAQVDPTRPFLVTSAGQYGTLLTRITLSYDLGARRLVSKQAENLVVQQSGEAAARQPDIAALVSRYQAAAADVTGRVVGRVAGPLEKMTDATGQSALGNLIADAQRAAMAAPASGGAQIAFMNPGGIRGSITPGPDGTVSFGDLYRVQPFGNTLVVKALTGAQIREALEFQFLRAESPSILSVSKGFSFAFDLRRPAGQRIVEATLDGAPLNDETTYRVAMSNFLGQGGDGFTMLADAPLVAEGPLDVAALEAYVASRPGMAVPALDRIRNLSPQ